MIRNYSISQYLGCQQTSFEGTSIDKNVDFLTLKIMALKDVSC